MTKDDSLDTLRDFVATIMDSERELTSLGGPILHYGLFLRQILDSQKPEFQNQRDINLSTQTPSGEALTPWHAAACMEDRTRTAAFIRGSIRAVQHQLDQCSLRPLHLIEAGCGPLGTLVLPLLAHFNSDDLVVSLIDLHEESIKCVEIILDHFGFLPRVKQLIHGDATAIATDSPAQLILTETMNTALGQEPQVAITRALMQKHPDALLIPQSIRIDLTLLNIKAETSQFPAQVSDRIPLGLVFELNRQTALDLIEENGMLPANTIPLPDNTTPETTPCLTTTIQVFEDTQVSDYETQISCPVPLQPPGQPPLAPRTTIQFTYQMKGTPGFVWHPVDQSNKG